MEATIHDIDEFERRLELKTLQEGLKHKAASTGITTDVLGDAMGRGISDYEERTLDSYAEGEGEGGWGEYSGEGTWRSSAEEEDVMDGPPPNTQPQAVRGTSFKEVVAVQVPSGRKIEVQLLHAANLHGPDLEFKSGIANITCNPYCMVRYRHELCVGKVVKRSRNPVFNDKFVFHAPLEGAFGEAAVDVFSRDETKQPDTFIGSARIMLDGLELEAGKPQEHWLNLDQGKEGTLHYMVLLHHIFK